MMTKLAELEALLYIAGDDGISKESLENLLKLSQTEVDTLLQQLTQKLSADSSSGLTLLQINNNCKLATKPEVSSTVEKYFQKDVSKTLSQSALEILSIVAYRQPITRVEIDDIRGVNSSGAIQTLIWRGLIKASGKKDAPGHPNLYITTDYFLQYFGYQSLADLPVIEDFEDDLAVEDEEVDLFDRNQKEEE
ncbi:SMC-Scp complex subunit ScpB [Lactobacillus sp. LL6]|uniref:SMC-Scp complex subunit ScpB n=1 Tax=Lactobacillus sp. LL6 TaxID=2596827 RepID=UPI001186FECC|nr:SMC-Scp complex subunit ScpB [Lactobacillus sp. LL6]TSO27061.1 SMC-Scp complex subunit ScpB [Lactobacillus sp. LL6]